MDAEVESSAEPFRCDVVGQAVDNGLEIEVAASRTALEAAVAVLGRMDRHAAYGPVDHFCRLVPLCRGTIPGQSWTPDDGRRTPVGPFSHEQYGHLGRFALQIQGYQNVQYHGGYVDAGQQPGEF